MSMLSARWMESTIAAAAAKNVQQKDEAALPLAIIKHENAGTAEYE